MYYSHLVPFNGFIQAFCICPEHAFTEVRIFFELMVISACFLAGIISTKSSHCQKSLPVSELISD